MPWNIESKHTVFPVRNGLLTIAQINGLVLGADTRAKVGSIVEDKKCSKIHYLALNMYCCGSGIADNNEKVTRMSSSQLELYRLATNRVVPFKVPETKCNLFRVEAPKKDFHPHLQIMKTCSITESARKRSKSSNKKRKGKTMPPKSNKKAKKESLLTGRKIGKAKTSKNVATKEKIGKPPKNKKGPTKQKIGKPKKSKNGPTKQKIGKPKKSKNGPTKKKNGKPPKSKNLANKENAVKTDVKVQNELESIIWEIASIENDSGQKIGITKTNINSHITRLVRFGPRSIFYPHVEIALTRLKTIGFLDHKKKSIF